MFAAIAALSVFAPALGPAAAAPFLLVAGGLFFGVREGPIFETLALPGDRKDRRLYGVVAFAMATAGLAIFASIPGEPLPYVAFAAAALAVGFGRLGRALFARHSDGEFVHVVGYLLVGGFAALIGQLVVAAQTAPGTLLAGVPVAVFIAATASLSAALIRSLVYDRDAHITVIIAALIAWAFTALVPTVTVPEIAIALAVTVGLGYAAYALGTASVPGMLTGVLLALLTVVLGGVGWFLTLISFYAIGGLASKYRFDEKADRGVAQENQGARGTGNVLANSAVALAALIGYAATDHLGIPAVLFGFAFAGAIATALADTLSSEIGGLFDRPRLITTLRPVEPGTDGAITWQGELAGIAGTAVVAVLAATTMPLGDPALAGGVVGAAGFVGMTVDSLLGALIEGERVGNQGVNFLATLAGGLVAVAFAIGVGVGIGAGSL